MTKIKEKDITRFMSFVRTENDDLNYCWKWLGASRKKDNRGRFWVGGKMHYAPIVSFLIYNGNIPKGFIVRHKCDNPNCVNPEHLELGTYSDNSKDIVVRNRRSFRGDNSIAKKLNTKTVEEIRNRLSSGEKASHLAREFGVHRNTVGCISRNETWVNL